MKFINQTLWPSGHIEVFFLHPLKLKFGPPTSLYLLYHRWTFRSFADTFKDEASILKWAYNYVHFGNRTRSK